MAQAAQQSLTAIAGGGTKVRPKLQLVTPQKAERWLKKNEVNRRLRDSHITRLARDMDEGRWELNGESVKFDSAMNLLDGQHRLMACVRAGKPFYTVVVYDVRPEAMKNIDIGIKRQFSDRLKLEGVEKYHTLIASITSMFHEFETNASGGNRASHEELAEVYGTHALEFVKAASFVSEARVGPSGVNLTAAALAFMFFSRTAPNVAEEYITACVSGEAITRQHPAWTVRAKVQRAKDQGQPLKRNDHFAIIVRGWNAQRAGRSYSKAYTRGKGEDAKTWREIKILK